MGKLFTALKNIAVLLLVSSVIVGCSTGGLSDKTSSSSTPGTTTGKGAITFAVVKSSDPNTATTSISTGNPAIIKATAIDSTGTVLVGKVVSFTSTFDIKFSPASGTALTDSSGTAAITVLVGTTAGAATITASVADSTGTVITNDTGITVNPQAPPAVPAGVTATAVSSSQINLTWMPSAGAAGYKIFKGGVLTQAVTPAQAADSGLLASTPYCYAVSAYDKFGDESDKSSQVCATTYGPPPAIPTNLSVRATSPTQVDLSWTASAGASQYKIYRNGVLLPVSISAPVTTYSDTSVVDGNLYSYTITAIDNAGSESNQTSQSPATIANTGLTVPKDIKLAVDSSAQITLSWANSGGSLVKGYNVYRDAALFISATTTSIVDGGLTPSTQYCYNVSAKNALGTDESAKSVTVCGRTQPLQATPKAVAVLSMGTDIVSVKSDNSNSATITASALDSNNALIEGATINFNSTGGAISTASATTDANGQAVIKLSSGTLDKSNRVVTITATASGAPPANIPIQILGSKLTMTSTSTNITAGTAPVTLTVKAIDAGEKPVYNVPITLSFVPVNPPAVQGSASLSAMSGITDVNGVLLAADGKPITVTGIGAGTVRIKAEGLGAVQLIDYAITGIGEPVFSITEPSSPPFSCDTSSFTTVKVRTSLAGQTVVFSSSLGVWDGGTSSVVEKVGDAKGSILSATLRSTLAGTASVQVYDKSAHSISDNISIAFFAPAISAASIKLQVSPNIINKSAIGGVSNTATLTATVISAFNQVVGRAPVAFSIVNPIGGGETVFPVVVYTDDAGIAKSTLSSGVLSTGSQASSLTIMATIVGTAFSDTAKIIIGGTAGSVVVGYGNVITNSSDSTYYTLPMAVLVADSSGAPIKNQQVSINSWPSQYSAVSWYVSNPYEASSAWKWAPYVALTSNNEDVNENLIMNPGEDINGDGFLTPPNSAAGTLPATVFTDVNGVGGFNLTYLKGSAVSIVDRIRASTLVYGTETSSSITFRLPYEKIEGESGNLNKYFTPITLKPAAGVATCKLAPFHTGSQNAFSTSSLSSSITADGNYTYNVPIGTASGTILHDAITVSDIANVVTSSSSGPVTFSVSVDVSIYVP